jgi:hypothetical protein
MNVSVISDVTSAGLLSRRLTTDLAAPQRLWWELIASLLERYRPELHYARGGPELFSLVECSVRQRAHYRGRNATKFARFARRITQSLAHKGRI